MSTSTEPRAAQMGQTGRLPDFFIVGQPKSGTTALYEMLRTHPEIFMPDTKELGFFAPELHLRRPTRPDGRENPTTLEDYAAHFLEARPEQRVGEATVHYLWSPTAASRIAELQPAARIIAMLREPASLLRSWHLQLVRIYAETEPDLRRALALEASRRAGRDIPEHTAWPQLLLYSEQVRYVEQLRRYRERFPPEQLLVLIYDDFLRDNAGTLRQVLRFLEVDDSLALPASEANPTVRVRSKRLHAALHAMSVGHGPASRAAKATVKAILPRAVRRRALLAAQNTVVFGAPALPDEELVLELRRRFRGEVVALS